jgi:putative FmdB family regulatory protein
MPRRMFEFKCKNCNSIAEKFVDETVKTSTCDECGTDSAERIISACGIYLEPFTGLHPSAYDRWNRVRAEKQAQERKRNGE